ncbi:major facilitator superfamily domain-containing protein [Boeremia exigua]|uniref:major facilitator superfamily domain-containing protein n=1 Tax=Boeremia exigua TaxID=749465 RepID=UPI001E8D1C9C|nr:major facilitator superfamily domain-containing protein [Boeremia exigua]KAH6611798.1 major facilitator superfamily domain-containing protein [Boeremia exigua]
MKWPSPQLYSSSSSIVDAAYDGSGTEDDPYIVDWLLPDQQNPATFTAIRKWSLTSLTSISALAVAFCSSAYSGGSRGIMSEFGSSQEAVVLGLSMFVLGLAVGPLAWGPVSELYGRQYVFVSSYAMLTVFNIAVAVAPNTVSLITFRFLAGAFGSSYQTNAGGVISDMFDASERGLALSLFAAAPFLGPVLGPIVSGFINQNLGWRWVQGVMAAFNGAVWISGTLLIPETYAPTLLQRRAASLSRLTGLRYVSRFEITNGRIEAKQAFKKALCRPWVLLFQEPIVLLLSIYVAILYGILYMLFPAFPIVYQEARGWSDSTGGLAFIGLAVGMVISVGYSILENRRYNGLLRLASESRVEPETRLPAGIVGAVAIPIGLFWFAWTNSASEHWLISIAASIPLGFGVVLVILAVVNYLIDSYTAFAASVLAANAVLRSIFGAAFPLFTAKMYDSLGVHWASSIPAFLALACLPFMVIFYIYGSTIRARGRFASEAAKLSQGQLQRDRSSLGSEEARQA